MHRPTLFVLTLLLASCATPAPTPAEPAPTEASPPSEVVIATPYYRLVGPIEVTSDARLLASTLDQAIARLCVDFASVDAGSLLRKALVEFQIASAPNSHCGVGQATAMTSWSNGVCSATIHLLAPSVHPDPSGPNASRTMSGEPHDAAYCQRVLVHEYSTILLESITRAKSKGWSFQSAPGWFVQGSEEYLGVTYSVEQARARTLPAYLRLTREQHLVTDDFGLDVQSPYVAGAALVAFIMEHYGREKYIALLRSPAASWGRAMRDELHATPEEFFEAFSAWLKSKTA